MSNPAEQETELETVDVALGDRSYRIEIGSNRLLEFGAYLKHLAASIPHRSDIIGKLAVITDSNISGTHAADLAHSLADVGWPHQMIVLDAGETSKSLDVIATVYDRLVEFQADRQTIIVAIGGGVVGDAAGFVAATFGRGIPFVQVPTTLLAQVDSSVGGKVGVNHPKAKNLIGAFHQPKGVFIDTATLKTLPDRDYRSGLAEVIKYGVILDAEFFEFLETHIADINDRDPQTLRHVIATSCRLKADVVERDEFERTGLRAVLNYGHTFAHAFEALFGYGELTHGEAVAIGMIHASRLAERLQLIETDVTARQISLLGQVQLPTRLPETSQLKTDEILDRMKLDKKTVAGRLRFVLPTKLGHVEVFQDVPEADVRAVLDTTPE